MNKLTPSDKTKILSEYFELISIESDRGAVLVAASLLDEALELAIRQRLIPSATADDKLFNGPTAPLSTFSAKIEIAYRLGIVVGGLSRALHLFRKLRNEFAHTASHCSFEKSDTAKKLSVLFRKNQQLYDFVTMPRGSAPFSEADSQFSLREDFDLYYSYLAMKLVEGAHEIQPLTSHVDEKKSEPEE